MDAIRELLKAFIEDKPKKSSLIDFLYFHRCNRKRLIESHTIYFAQTIVFKDKILITIPTCKIAAKKVTQSKSPFFAADAKSFVCFDFILIGPGQIRKKKLKVIHFV